MFFVQHNAAQPGHGQKQGRARAHHQAGILAFGQLAEGGLPSRWGLVAVVEVEGRSRQGAGRVPPQLVGQGHLRSQQQQTFAGSQAGLGQLQIHGRLAAACYAEQQA